MVNKDLDKIANTQILKRLRDLPFRELSELLEVSATKMKHTSYVSDRVTEAVGRKSQVEEIPLLLVRTKKDIDLFVRAIKKVLDNKTELGF